jgi:LmeA-like phospholipid-binding
MNPWADGAVYSTSRLSQEEAVANRLQSLKNPTSIVLIAVITVALMCAGLLGGELYTRHWAQTMLTAMVKCMVDDDANVSIATAPPMLVQIVTGRYTEITIATAGKQLRSAKGMTVVVEITDLHLQHSGASAGTIGSLNAAIGWTDDGMKRTAQEANPLLGGFVTGVTTDPSAGTIAVQGQLGSVTAKPAVADGGLRLQVKSLTGLGLPLPADGLQSILDTLATDMKKDLPTGLRVDGVQVTDTGVAAHFSARNVSIPTTWQETCSPGQN